MAEEVPTWSMGPAEEAATLPAGRGTPEELGFGSTIGRYLVLNVLGRGGMGVVYEAYDPVLDRKIAVKRLREASDDGEASAGRARMQREAQALARLSHPNVITVHDVSDYAGAMYIAMELVQGKTMREWQTGRGWREVVGGYAAAARGLAAAHEAGLIHRDFKPDNVLVGDDGRVRVTDFGLARLAHDTPAQPSAPVAAPTSALADQLTAVGQVMGTPSYMAPEQIDGGNVDARSDQFAWCISLWEAIYGEPPFAGGTLAIRSAAMKIDTPRPPAKTRVPRAVARLLVRGLKPDPAQRWASMNALLAELDRATSTRKAVLAASSVAALAVAIAVFTVGRRAGEATPRCDAAGAPVAAAWTDATERELARRFESTGAPFARDAATALGHAVTGWRTRWQRIATESCEATHVQGIQTAAALDLRSACLLRARDQLGVVLGRLADADRRAVETAPAVALPDLDACSDLAALSGAAAPPRDPVAVKALEGRIDAVFEAAKRQPALAQLTTLLATADELVTAAKKLGSSSLLADARRTRALLEGDQGKGKLARATLVTAAADALADGNADLAIEIYVQLAELEAEVTAEYALGESWLQIARSHLGRLAPRPGKQHKVNRTQGVLAQRAGRPREAREAFTAALALARNLGPMAEVGSLIDLGNSEAELDELASAAEHLERAYQIARGELGSKHPQVATAQHDLAVVAFRAGRYAESERLLREALAIREAAFGADSVDVATTIQAIGNAEISQDRPEQARAHFTQAISLLEARLGPDHPDVAGAYNDIGGVYHRAGHYELALATSQRVLAMREKALGPDHPDVAQSLVNIAIEAKNLERWELVDPSYQRALAVYRKAYGNNSFEVGITNLNLGEAKRAQRAFDAAAAAYAQAREILVGKLGEDHPLVAHVWNGLGQLALARGQVATALPLLERAVAMRARDGVDATDLAESRFALATAIAATDPARAIALARQARDVYRDAGRGYASRLAAAESWLAAHPPTTPKAP